MIRRCEYEGCGVEFEGSPQSHYCPTHRLLLQREARRRYVMKNPDKIKAHNQRYYLQNREKIVARQRAYNAAKGHKPREYKRASGWTVEFVRNGELWTWSARKGNVVLDAGRDFSTLRIAQKDCLLALG